MKLTVQQAYALLEKHGSYVTELCDTCGKGIGPVRFTRKDDPGYGAAGNVEEIHHAQRAFANHAAPL